MMSPAGKPAGASSQLPSAPNVPAQIGTSWRRGDVLPDIDRGPARRGQDRRAHRAHRGRHRAHGRRPLSAHQRPRGTRRPAPLLRLRQSPAEAERLGPPLFVHGGPPDLHPPRRRGAAAPRRARPSAHRHHRPEDRPRQRRAAHRDRGRLPRRGSGHQPAGAAAPAGPPRPGRPGRGPPDRRLDGRPIPRQHGPRAAQGLVRPPGRASPRGPRPHRRRPLLSRERRDRRRPRRGDRRRNPGRGERRAPGRPARGHGPGEGRRHPRGNGARRRRRRPGGPRRRGGRAAPGADGARGGGRRPGAARIRRGQRRPHHDHRLRARARKHDGGRGPGLDPRARRGARSAAGRLRRRRGRPRYPARPGAPAHAHPQRSGDAGHRGDGRGPAHRHAGRSRRERRARPRRIQPPRRAGARRGETPAGNRDRGRRSRGAAARDLATPRRPEFRLMRKRLWPYLLALGPGLLAASAGNDAGGIATYASAGASYGYGLLWAMVVVTVCVGVVQEMSAGMGAVTGKGFSDLVRESFTLRQTALILLTLLIANLGIIVSEFIGVAAAAELFGVSRYVAVPLAAIFVWLLITRSSYGWVEKIFLFLTLAFLAYIAAAFLAKPDWGEVMRQTVAPRLRPELGYLNLLIALIGTTISPYMQLYVQSSVVEKGVTPEEYRYTRFDVVVGTISAGVVAVFIIIATAATLYPRHIAVDTAAAAARALEPVAGHYAEALFAIGLLGASLLAAGVLPLATTYMLSEALGFERSVSHSWAEAPIFMGTFTGLIVLGAGIALIPGLPLIQVLVGVYVLNGLLLPVELFAILRLVNDPEIMGDYVNGKLYNLVAWAIAIVVSLLSLALIVMTVVGWFR